MMPKQYRTHPTICEMASSIFYEGKLVSAANLRQDRALDHSLSGLLQPVCFIDIHGNEQQEEFGTSRFNEAEIKLCLKIVQFLVNSGVSCKEIGVVAAYAAQSRMVEQRIHNAQGLAKVKVGSIDSFQGREKEYIIVSYVRSRRGIGFLSVPNRINVAVTRARKSLIIVGHAATFTKHRKDRKSTRMN